MLINTHSTDVHPERVLVLGGEGFIGKEIVRLLLENEIPVVSLGRKNIDLLSEKSTDQLIGFLKPNDVLIFVSALAPCKDLVMLQDNLKMAEVVCKALLKVPVSHVIYVSSDAVYKDSLTPIIESSCAEPASLHGVMHLAREIALKQSYFGPLAIVRPTLVYGLKDPHNGYGPNRFRRLAYNGSAITLFGEGEEQRDHVYVEDIAALIYRILLLRSAGIVNAVSGEVVSFRELAEFISREFSPPVLVNTSPRIGSVPHGGYRSFDNRAVLQAFPGFVFKTWREGMRLVHQKQYLEPKSESL
jgi:nucleoside-diphosphate-sugar epimerase